MRYVEHTDITKPCLENGPYKPDLQLCYETSITWHMEAEVPSIIQSAQLKTDVTTRMGMIKCPQAQVINTNSPINNMLIGMDMLNLMLKL